MGTEHLGVFGWCRCMPHRSCAHAKCVTTKSSASTAAAFGAQIELGYDMPQVWEGSKRILELCS